eukprot:1160009-Pelagomonas_calceolata.AAC.1
MHALSSMTRVGCHTAGSIMEHKEGQGSHLPAPRKSKLLRLFASVVCNLPVTSGVTSAAKAFILAPGCSEETDRNLGFFVRVVDLMASSPTRTSKSLPQSGSINLHDCLQK